MREEISQGGNYDKPRFMFDKMSCPSSKETMITRHKYVGNCKNRSGQQKQENGFNNSPPSLDIHHLQTDQRNKNVVALRAVKPPTRVSLSKSYSAKDS